MAEAIATGLAVEAAKAATKLVTARVLDEITLAFGFQDQLVKLHDKFSNIQALLEDLGSAKYVEKSRFVNLWLKKLTDVTYSADELMDDYEYQLLRRKIELKNNHPSFKKKCSNFLNPATNPAVFRIRMSHRVREILSKFDELHKEAKNNGIQLGQLAREAVASTSVGYYVGNEALHQSRKHAVARGSEFIGRKSDEEKLLQMILNPIGEDVDRLSTVAIVGIGGLGKTTIARKLYEHDGHFDKKIWICVSEDFKVDRLLNEMVEHLTSSKCDLTNTGAITNKLKEHLKGKKFFLVLDDVWENNQDSWNFFKNSLLSIGDLRGCVILITTRTIDVAEKARAFYQHKLPYLSEGEGWALLQQIVFSETCPYDSSFNNVGRRIVNKCRGVPLAIKAIGGTLQSKKHVYEWELIENSEQWDFQPGDINDILPSLMLSYNHLNHVYVKQCFAYCAIFPKDFNMNKHQFINLWLAQGFLHDKSATSSSTLTMELVGETYFNILLNHSFLEKKEGYYVDGIRYKMHDLVHDLAAYILENELLVWKVGSKRVDFSHVRHLVFDLAENESPPETFSHWLTTRKLRTLCFRGSVPSWNNLFGSARFVRVLIMDDLGLTEVPFFIGQLVHLRYLDLSYNDFDILPACVCKLYELQTLRIFGCSKLEPLPRELHRLENLRHIVTQDILLASTRLRQLTNLQTLPPLELRDGEGWSIDELGPLDQLKGEVRIRGLEHVKNKEEARQAGLGRKDKIVKLHLQWRADRESVSQVNNDEDVLDSLEPHSNLQTLYVDMFMGVRFPWWIMTAHMNLVEVRLLRCLRCLELPSLGQLPLLRILVVGMLDDLECIGETFYQSGHNNSSAGIELIVVGSAEKKVLFPSLRELQIISCKRLTTWMPASPYIQSEIIFPKLETLEIKRCPQLEKVPCIQLQSVKDLKLDKVGDTQSLEMEKVKVLPQKLSYFTKLENLSVWYCENMKCIPSGLISLKKLAVRKCPSLACIPDDLSSLSTLEIRVCPLLACIPDGLSSLRELIVIDCEGLESLPKSLEECSSLELVCICECPLIKGPIPDLGRLEGLIKLYLINSGELMIPCLQWIPNLHSLWELKIGGFGNTPNLPKLTYPHSLRKLSLQDFPNIKFLPQQFLSSTLHSLEIFRFDELEQIPEWIGNLSSLQSLTLLHCNKLKCLLPLKHATLQGLYIAGCPLLTERCAKDGGSEWPHISHIPSIHIS